VARLADGLDDENVFVMVFSITAFCPLRHDKMAFAMKITDQHCPANQNAVPTVTIWQYKNAR
jgi:hypothetical protein